MCSLCVRFYLQLLLTAASSAFSSSSLASRRRSCALAAFCCRATARRCFAAACEYSSTHTREEIPIQEWSTAECKALGGRLLSCQPWLLWCLRALVHARASRQCPPHAASGRSPAAAAFSPLRSHHSTRRSQGGIITRRHGVARFMSRSRRAQYRHTSNNLLEGLLG